MVLKAYFSNHFFYVSISDDIVGVQLGGVFKNIIAVAVGVSDGLKFGENIKAALITRGLGELVKLGNSLGAKTETLIGLSGCGDLILTCTCNQSRNRRFGLALSADNKPADALRDIGHVVEAVSNITELCKLSEQLDIKLPVVYQVKGMLKEHISPKEVIKNLFV